MVGFLVFSLSLLALPGCQEQEGIRRYSVAHVDQGKRGNALEKREPGAKDRMLGAIVPHTDQTWFFKLTGPDEKVMGELPAFTAFIKSVKFTGPDDPPTWTAPAAWRELPGSAMRYATFEIGSPDAPLELTVIPLPTSPGDPDDQTLSNINRWRGQLGLAPMTKGELTSREKPPDGLVRVALEGGLSATVVNLLGESQQNPMGGAPFASGPRPNPRLDVPPREAPLPEVATTTGPTPLTYQTPTGWTPGKTSSMRKAAFEVVEGAEKVEITVIDLAAQAGSLLPNINRWRQQIKLGETSDEALGRELKKIKVGDLPGDYIQIVGPAGDKQQSILGVIAIEGPRAWFIKLQGDAALAERERSRFEAFVQSVKFRKADGVGDGK